MDDKTEALLAKLAEKFGTTAEHLWAILIRQAPISSVCDLFTSAVCLAYVFWSIWYFRNHKRLEDKPRLSAFWFLILGFIPACMVLYGLCEMHVVIAGFVNPEYWALKQIIP